MTIIPFILAGGTGSRLWPLSRELYPKQFLPLAGEHPMFVETLAGVSDPARFGAPYILCNETHRFIVAQQCQGMSLPGAPTIMLEPAVRSTAPALAAAALLALATDPDAILLALAADHVFGDRAAFVAQAAAAADAARDGALVTFGIRPTGPETGYGYVKPTDRALAGGAFALDSFTEKPDRETAERLVREGWLWNAGIFLFTAARLVEELEVHAPDVLDAARRAVEASTRDLDFVRLDATAFAAAPNISIDHAVMEKTARAAVVPVDVGWSDIGSWDALWEIGEKDGAGNVLEGDAIALGSTGSYLRGEDGLMVMAVGVEDLTIVATEDCVLVLPRGEAQEVKRAVTALKEMGREEARTHRRVHRPWGSYQSLHVGERFQVKRISVEPGAKLSLQKHFHRAEHWVVVHGTALVTRDDEEVLLRENESIYLPLGCVHRLDNPGKVPLILIEVQSGSYLGEDDIVRLEDTYGRG